MSILDNIFGNKKSTNISDHKKELLKVAKEEYHLNVNADMSEYELEHRIAEAKEQAKPEPTKTKSTKTGEY